MISLKDSQLIVEKFFEENKFVKSNIDSFNNFIDWRLQQVIDEVKEAVPAVIPPDVEEVKFVFGKVRVGKPSIIEADGSERKLTPMESRLRSLTYSSPVFLEVSIIIDGKERERVEVEIAQLPVMLKSKLCYLYGLSPKELIAAGEDPEDAGGYFIVNGTEKRLVLLEDLAPNTIFVERGSGAVTHVAKLFSANETYRIPHALQRTKDGLFLLDFTSLSKVPLLVLIKALGVVQDKDVMALVGLPEMDEDLYVNFYEYVDIKSIDAAQEFLGKMLHLSMSTDKRTNRIEYILDNLLLPHVGKDKKDRVKKAQLLGRMLKKLILFRKGKIAETEKDHYMNKRVRLAGDLLEDLLRTNFKGLINDALYIFQRGVRRGRLLPIHSVIRTKLLTSRLKSAMATGNWTGNRQGVSQRLDRENIINTISHLRTVVSLLESSRESFQARELHPTHWGRLCPIQSPEGKNIGLRKNLALLGQITPQLREDEVSKTFKTLETLGLEEVK